MDLFDVVRSCARRWYVVLPLMLLAAWFSYGAYSSVKPVYYSNAVIGVAPPSTRVDQAATPGTPLPRNGLLDIGGAQLIANMTAMGLQQKPVVDRVVAAGGMPNYSAKLFPVPETSPPVPMVFIEETAPDPDEAVKTLKLVIDQAGVTLRTLQQQAGVPADQMVTPFVVSPPANPPITAMPSRTRSTIAIFVAGTVISVMLGVVVDAVLTRRRTNRQLTSAEAAAKPKPGDPLANGHDPSQGPRATEAVVEAQ